MLVGNTEHRATLF